MQVIEPGPTWSWTIRQRRLTKTNRFADGVKPSGEKLRDDQSRGEQSRQVVSKRR